MSEFLTKLSSYNLFNYLLPGAVFMYFMNQLDIWKINETNIILEIFLYYFVGMTISRVGSVILEPIFMKLRIINFADYKDYLTAKDNDPQIETLLEQNNTYRTITALFLVLGATYAFNLLVKTNFLSEVKVVLLAILGLFLLFCIGI